MNKEEIQKRVSQNGKSLDFDKFSWDEKTRTFFTNECYLVLDFKDINNIIFKAGDGCTFDTGYGCTFDTGCRCTFKTGWGCNFKTGPSCTFDTDNHCTFDTDNHCMFDTGDNCTFNTGWGCTFRTVSSCTFKTESSCTFETGSDCMFDTDSDCTFDIFVGGYFINKTSNNIVVVRDYDNYKIYELNKLPKGLLCLKINEVIEEPNDLGVEVNFLKKG